MKKSPVAAEKQAAQPALPRPNLPDCGRRIGAHMPTAGGLHKSLTAGREIGCTAIQVFTSSPRQWKSAPIKDVDRDAFRAAHLECGEPFLVAHDSYLINLAAPDPEVLERSQEAFRSELDRAEQLGIAWLVTHMGAHLGQGEAEAVARLAASLKSILDATDALGYTVGIALETTAGQGTGLGATFDQLGEVLRAVGEHPRLGVCLDTCHIFVAGYDLRDEESYEKTWDAFETHIGRRNLKVIHANDAKKPLGSKVDRHEHIGEGEIGLEAFARLVTDPRLKHVPIIVETPDSETMHGVNVERLVRLAAGEPAFITVSVQFFGHYSDATDGAPVSVKLPARSTVATLARTLAKMNAAFVDLEKHCRFAVKEEYTDLETVLSDGDLVAVLPPMSGG